MPDERNEKDVTKSQFPIPAVRAIIADDHNRVLLLKRANTAFGHGAWCLPGGKIDFGQTAEDAILREIEEEVALKCTSVEFLMYQDSLPTPEFDSHFINLYFICEAQGEIALNDESSEYAWIGEAEIAAYDVVFRNREGIRAFWANR